ncbi:MAG: DUF1833 domain-containing protein [Synergistaceae bacterium]|jgi:hypothetical protein|nr:DUF1833 domain-containing protein [Synergistaceae bacterium]MCK9437299.1 DUF1833 domain-containing protein [Synergistaceae bacterium]
MTTTSLNFREAAFAQETGRCPIALITLSHDDLTEPIRISTDPTQRITELTTDSELVYGTVSNGDNYVFLPVNIKLPDDTDEGPWEMQLEFDNVHRAYTEAIRSIFTPVTCQVDIVMDDALDTIDASWPEFQLTNIRYNATAITGTLKLETLEAEPYPAGAFVPSCFPGLF